MWWVFPYCLFFFVSFFTSQFLLIFLSFTGPEVEAMHDLIILVMCIMGLVALFELARSYSKYIPGKVARHLPSKFFETHHREG